MERFVAAVREGSLHRNPNALHRKGLFVKSCG
jgi:hypothetical protein